MPSSPLASAEQLPAAVQRILWHRGSLSTRTELAKRPDLDPEVEAHIAGSGDEAVLQAYLRHSRRDAASLARVAAGPLAEGPAQLLAVQRNATPAVIDMLLERDWASVASVLLLREDLSSEQRARAAVTYVRGRVRIGWSDTQSLMDRIGVDEHAWVCALSSNLLGGSAVPLAAAVSCGSSPLVQDAVISWWESNPVAYGTDAESDRIRSLARLLTSPTLAPEYARRIGALTADSAIVARANALAEMRVHHWLEEASNGAVSSEALRGLAEAHSMTVDVDSAAAVRAYYLAPFALAPEADDALSRLARTLPPGGAAAILDDLLEAGLQAEALNLLVRLSSYVPLEYMNKPEALVRALSTRGDRLLLRSPVAVEHAETLAWHYRPLHDALTLPAVAGHVVRTISDTFGSDVALVETAVALADEWQGSLTDLLSATRALTNGGLHGRQH